MSNPAPTTNETTYVEITSNQPNAPVTTVAYYKTTSTPKTTTSGADGGAQVGYDISRATPGYTVLVRVTVGSATCETSFTPA